jgi:predicted NAD-dependent protein-ADP-ribosyltransferase YbiA (DUF1768 family)
MDSRRDDTNHASANGLISGRLGVFRRALRLLRPDGSGARPGLFVWLGNDPILRQFLPRAEVPIRIDGETYPSSQAWFESRKDHVRQRGHSWAANCDTVMFDALRAKFLQHPALRERLLATGDAALISDSGTEGGWAGYWTEREGVPFNALGHILMKVRENLRARATAD